MRNRIVFTLDEDTTYYDCGDALAETVADCHETERRKG